MSFLLVFAYIFTVVFSSFTTFISKRKFGIWINHYALYNLYWIACLTISIFFNNYDRPVSDEVYFIFFIGTFAFNSTLFLFKIRPYQRAYKPSSEYYSLKKRRLIELLVLGMIVPLAYNNLKLILSGVELWIINHDYWETQRQEGSYLQLMFMQNIVQPLSTLIMVTCMFSKYYDRKKTSGLICVVVGVSMAILNVLLTGGGRTGLMTLIYVIFLSYAANKIMPQSNVFPIKTKYVVGFIIFAFAGIAWASMGRGDEKMLIGVLTERLELFAALFEGYYVDTHHCEGYTLGLAMFETPIAIITYPFKSLGLDFERISTLEQMPQWTPATASMHNANVSAYLYYMKDFGKFGVVLGPVITAYIYMLLYKCFCKSDFLVFFYFTGICVTCFETTYPFGRGFVFLIIFALLYDKYTRK